MLFYSDTTIPRKTWRYHAVTALLFAIEVQYKLIMLFLLTALGCFCCPVLAIRSIYQEVLPSFLTVLKQLPSR